MVFAVVLACGHDGGDIARIAVASNFAPTLADIARNFEAETGHSLVLSSASTGKLYAQVVNGAPFDLLFAADAERPERLEQNGFAIGGSRRTYAIGRLVVWSGDPRFAGRSCRDALADASSPRVAIANPRTAPYGAAARDALVALGMWERLQSGLVYGENITQTLQFAASGNAAFAVIALAQLQRIDAALTACHWIVPAGLHEPIRQQLVLLERGAGNPAALALLEYLSRPDVQDLVDAAGYGRGN